MRVQLKVSAHAQAENADSVDEECRLMTMAELSYINRVREAQAKKYPKKK